MDALIVFNKDEVGKGRESCISEEDGSGFHNKIEPSLIEPTVVYNVDLICIVREDDCIDLVNCSDEGLESCDTFEVGQPRISVNPSFSHFFLLRNS